MFFRFTLSAASNPMQPPALDITEHAFFEHLCTMWKTVSALAYGGGCGVRGGDGAQNKRMVMITKWEIASISFTRLAISCVMEAKAEFCHSIKLGFFLLDSTNETDML